MSALVPHELKLIHELKFIHELLCLSESCVSMFWLVLGNWALYIRSRPAIGPCTLDLVCGVPCQKMGSVPLLFCFSLQHCVSWIPSCVQVLPLLRPPEQDLGGKRRPKYAYFFPSELVLALSWRRGWVLGWQPPAKETKQHQTKS